MGGSAKNPEILKPLAERCLAPLFKSSASSPSCSTQSSHTLIQTESAKRQTRTVLAEESIPAVGSFAPNKSSNSTNFSNVERVYNQKPLVKKFQAHKVNDQHLIMSLFASLLTLLGPPAMILIIYVYFCKSKAPNF